MSETIGIYFSQKGSFKSKVKVPSGLVSGEAAPWPADGGFSLCPRVAEREGSPGSLPLMRTPVLGVKAQPLGLSKRPSLQCTHRVLRASVHTF